MPNNHLSKKENDIYTKEMSEVLNRVIADVIDFADAHNVDRDNAVQHFATILKTMSEISTFQHWGDRH